MPIDVMPAHDTRTRVKVPSAPADHALGDTPFQTPDVSIIIANFNGRLYLADAVRSVARQSMTNIEILIADDNSSDDSPEIARALALLDRRIRFLPATLNTGPAGARNRALAVARGTWIAILDNDDLMHPLRLEHLIHAAERLHADIVADDLVVVDSRSDGEAARFLDKAEAAGPFEVTPARYFAQTVMYGAKPNLGFLKPVIRRSALVAAGLCYDETLRIAEDDDLIIRALAAGLRYWVVPGLTYFYRKHAQSISHRTSVADLEAMMAVSEQIGQLFPDADRPTRRAMARRIHATRAALAFQRFVDLAKARRFTQALAALVRQPSAARLLRLPLAARLSWARPTAPGSEQDTRRHVLVISRQRIVGRTNGSSTYLLDIATAIRAAGMVPHLLQPAPSITGRRPVIALSRDLDVFETHRVRGVLKVGRMIVSLDPRVWRDAIRGVALRIGRTLGLNLDLSDVPYPHSIAIPWTDADRMFVTRYGRRHADVILADYVFQTEALAMVMRPDAPTAVILHDLYAQRADSFGEAAARDSISDLDEEQEIALMGRADAVVAIQAQEAAWVRDHAPGLHVITAPMAAYPVPAAQPGNDRDVLFVGSNTSPNVMALEWLFAMIWPLVRQAVPDARLIVAGSVGAAFAGTAVEGVDFLGLVRDLGALYRDAGVVISPLTVGSGLKIKLIEALAQGKAIVATSITLQGVEAEAGPAVIRANDTAAFAEGIVSLLRDRAERARRAELALAAAREDFSPQRCYGPLVDWLAGEQDRTASQPPGPACNLAG